MNYARTILIAMLALLLLAACGGEQPETSAPAEPTAAMTEDMSGDDDMMVEDMTDDDMADDTMTEGDMAEDDMSDETMSDDEDMVDDMASDDMMEDDMAEDDMASDDDMTDDTMSDDEIMDDDMAMADRPEWQTISLVNARTGESFTLSDFGDKYVFVESMATWCTNCRRQQDTLAGIMGEVPDDFVFVGLSVETNISAADLADYQDRQGYGWNFAVMTPDMLAQLVEQFGRTVSNPPSTPHFIIRPDGSVSELHTGFDSAAELMQMFEAARS